MTVPARRPAIAVLAIALLVAACAEQGTPLPGATATATPAASGATAATPATSPTPTRATPVPHRIGVRVVDGQGELYDRTSGARFVPRGMNYIRLAGAHVTLNVGHYDPARIDAALSEMARRGYNAVRIFLGTGTGGLPGPGSSLNPEFLDNAVDVLRRARAHGIFVLYTLDWLPESPGWSFASDPGIENVNGFYLSKGGVEASARFFRQLAQGFVDRGAPLDALLAYELRNELYFTEIAPPFSLRSGSVRTANGTTYDVSTAAAKRQLLEDGLVFWIDRMREAIVDVDPTALVTVGFFQPKGPNESRRGDDRLIETREAILRSSADFIDLHGYPGGDLTLPQIVENFGLPPTTAKPVILGEFGVERPGNPSNDDAVRTVVTWQMDSCRFGFDGWLTWTWDSTEQPDFWNAVENGGAIADALSPALRPDPCSLGGLDLAANLALRRPARASLTLPGYDAGRAVDGDPGSYWNAGSHPPQWIEIDLGARRTIAEVRLGSAMSPSGRMDVRVVGAATKGGRRTQLHRFVADVADQEVLVYRPKKPWTGVRFLRVEILDGPSWVAWREITVLDR
jgi:hypothetical protein